MCGIGAEAVAAQRPGKGIQHAGLALIVVAAHEGEPGGGGGERNGLDALDVFGLKGRDGYRHLDTSPWICPSVNEHIGQLLPLFGRKPAEGRNHHFADVLERAVGQQHVVIGAVGILFTAGSGLFQLCPQVGGHLGG